MTIMDKARLLAAEVAALPVGARVAVLNEVRRLLHEVSPFVDEPVDFVQWVPTDEIRSNSYNPNTVAPVEMELLRHSIRSDGYTQPVVGFRDGDSFEVVDGFHRNRVGREDPEVRARVHGYLPVVGINEGRRGISDRMASTVRHNRARGKHQVVKMSDIVLDLTRRGWKAERIAQELGMEPDEIWKAVVRHNPSMPAKYR